MESAALTPATVGARLRALPAALLARLSFAALSLATLVGFVVYPTYPNYDSYYSLLWGQEVLHGHLPSFKAYRAPTEHPLAIAVGALVSLIGRGGDRVLVGLTMLSFLALVWGMYRLGRTAFTPLVGLISAALLATRFDFPFLAARAYVDIPYLALVIWAAALEAERPRRGTPVLLLLAAASMMRPEAWVLIGLYFLWVAWPASWPDRLRFAALAAAGPLAWAALDAAVTGDPLYSLHATSGLAEELGRQKSLADIPSAVPLFFLDLVKAPVLAAAVAGLALATWLTPRRMAVPGLLLASGLGTFVLVGVAGLSVIERYLLVPSLALMVFAGVALGGWTMLRRGALRRTWALAAAAVVVYGVIFTLSRVTFANFTTELDFRGATHASLTRLLDRPGVRAGLRCGPLSVPNHKLIPDSRWLLAKPKGGVLARSDPRAAPRVRRGVAVYVLGRQAILRFAYTQDTDDPLIQVPGPGWHRVALDSYFSAYVRC